MGKALARRLAATLVLAIAPSVAFGQDWPNWRLDLGVDSYFSCIKNIEIPNYPPLATAAHVEGSITGSVLLGPQGDIKMVNTEGMSFHDELGNSLKQRFLVPPVEVAMRQAVFHSNCNGKRITVVFDFVLIGNRSDHPKQYIEFAVLALRYVEFLETDAPKPDPAGVASRSAVFTAVN